jgi:solute:Na+ symporter, SSS family
MLKKALLSVVAIAVVMGVILVALGFGPRDFVRIFGPPHLEALKEGEYLKGATVLVGTERLQGEYTFTMRVVNPTSQPLSLEGTWSAQPDCIVTPAVVSLSAPPNGEIEKTFHLTVSGRDASGKPVRIAQFRTPKLTGKWIWARWSPDPKSATAEQIPIDRNLEVRRRFATADSVVLGAYLVLMLIIGWWVGRRMTTTRSFFIADGKVHYVAVGVSILGTYLSALTMMALPAMSYGQHDLTYTIQLPCLIITAIIITGFVLPRYRAAGIVSIYEYLERRIDVSARILASSTFLVFSIARMALLTYLPALALSTVTGTPLWLNIVLMGAVTTIYTVIGGMEAVIWTDVAQVVVFIAGAFVTIGYIFYDVGATAFVDIGREYNKFRVVIPDFDVAKITTAWLILETIFQTVRIYGTQQDMTQRYLTTTSTERANRSVWIGILGYIPLGFIFYLSGTAIFTFYKAHPDVNVPPKPDMIYPYFVMNELPTGLAGLVIAAIFAAAMSSIDACMNSSSTICIEDFYKRLGRRQRTDREYLRLAQWLTVVWGIATVVLALSFMEIQYAQIAWGKVMGISTNGVLGLMALAFLPFRINKWAALAGFVASYACLFAMMSSDIIFLLWPVIGNLVCFFVALFLNPLFSGTKGEADARK